MAARAEARSPLSRERILAAALRLADDEGIDAVTMRRLGQALGFEAMSLYNHVANKDDVLDGITDLVLEESAPPSPARDWHTALRASALSVHQALRRHPWSCPLIMSPGRLRPGRLRYMERLLERLRQAGFAAETTYHAYHVLDGFIFGFSLWETSHGYTAEQVRGFTALYERTVTPAEYPYLHEHGAQHFSEGPHREVSAFELGLDLILDGLERLRQERPA